MRDLYRDLSLSLHPASLLVAVGIDLLWSLPEGALTASWVGLIFLPFAMLTAFLASFMVVTAIQRFSHADPWSVALTKGLALGVLAALPYSFVGLAVTAFWGFMRLTYGVDPEVILLGKLTRCWREIERGLRSLAPPEVRGRGVDEVINCLADRHVLSNSLASQLHHLRQQRNTNIHEMSTAELANLVDQVQAMQNTLRRRFLRF